MLTRCSLALFTAVLALAQTSTKRPIHIDGTVIEKETRAPIPNAKVTLVATENSDQQITTSDANGRFSFNTIESYNAFTLFGPSHDDLAASQFIMIKNMQRLACFHQHKIGYINRVINGIDCH